MFIIKLEYKKYSECSNVNKLNIKHSLENFRASKEINVNMQNPVL